jgi:hypothetical protein
MFKDDDIEEVIAQERQRGKRNPIDIAARRRHLKLLNAFRIALRENEETFKEFLIHELGQIPGTREYRESLRKWRAFRGSSS